MDDISKMDVLSFSVSRITRWVGYMVRYLSRVYQTYDLSVISSIPYNTLGRVHGTSLESITNTANSNERRRGKRDEE